MELKISPEPPDDVRAAIAAALHVEATARGGGESAWWRAGLEDAVGAHETVARPRSNPGAARA